MKKYPTSKEILEYCNGDKYEACQMTVQFIIEDLKNAREGNIIDALPENFFEKISKISSELDELIEKK
jgi:hypothetical protein